MSTVKLNYASSAGVALDCRSLASSASFVAGRESALIVNSGNLYVDIVIRGKIKTTAATSGTQVLIYAYSIIDDAPSYPDVFTGSDAALTLTTAGLGAGFLKLGAVLPLDSTSARTLNFEFSLAQIFGGTLPNGVGLFVTHNTGAALDGTSSNHAFNALGVLYTVA